MGALVGYSGNISCDLASALVAMVLDSRKALIQLEGFLFLGDPRRACASHRHLRDDSGSETNS